MRLRLSLASFLLRGRNRSYSRDLRVISSFFFLFTEKFGIAKLRDVNFSLFFASKLEVIAADWLKSKMYASGNETSSPVPRSVTRSTQKCLSWLDDR